jgi:hypothetical protein
MIRTKYLGPTNTRGARIKAWAGDRSVTIPYPYELNVEDAHAEAAAKLHDKMYGQDDGRFEYAVARSTKDDGYCFYRIERDAE